MMGLEELVIEVTVVAIDEGGKVAGSSKEDEDDGIAKKEDKAGAEDDGGKATDEVIGESCGDG